MIGSFLRRVSVVVFVTGLLAFSLGLPTLAFTILILAVLISPN